MLSGLGHNALIRRHHQEHHIHTANPGNHLLNKFLMSRYINNTTAGTVL